MSAHHLVLWAFITAFAASSPVPQAKPDLAGTWTRDDRRTAQAERDQQARVASGGEQLLLTMPRSARIDLALDDTTLTLTASGDGVQGATTCALDGKPRTTGNVVTTARLRRDRVEIETRVGDAPATRTEIFREGAALVIRDSRSEASATGSGGTLRSRTTYYTSAAK